LDEVQQDIHQMKICCNQMGDRLSVTREMSGKLMQHAEKLNEER
jgi:hypothetical protein